MRIIHTADWHLGRIFYERYLTEDQAYTLQDFSALVRDYRPDAVVVAGDIYDRAVPPTEAVHLWDDMVTELSYADIPLIAISGNHDSTDRLSYGTRLLRESGVYIYGMAEADTAPLVLEDAAGPVYFCPFAFADPATIRIKYDEPQVRDYDSLFRVQAERLLQQVPSSARRIAVAHAFVAGGSPSDSERPLSVGGSSQVGTDAFQDFHYTMLGHLHRPQTMAEGKLRYSGSLLKYSFNEADQPKGVDLVEIDAMGAVQRESVTLRKRHDLRIITGAFQELMGDLTPSSDDYLLLRLTDEAPVLAAMSRLREKFPNVLALEPIGLKAQQGERTTADIRRLTYTDMFAQFIEDVGGRPLDETETQVMAEVWQEAES